MRNFLYKAFIACLIVSATIAAFSVSSYYSLLNGNRLYNDGKYDEALREYSVALKRHPDSASIKYNTGAALYRLKDYKKAMESFGILLKTENSSLKASASFNIGNCLYRQGEQAENQDIETASRLYRAAIESYTKAIELNKNESDARFNKELTEKKLKDLLAGPKKQKPQGQKEKSGQDRGEKDNEQNSRRQSDNADNQKAVNAGISKKIDTIKEKFADKKLLRQGKTKATEMSREEAELLLEYHEKKEGSAGMLKDRAKGGHYFDVLKDW